MAKYFNFIEGKLAEAISDSATSITVIADTLPLLDNGDFFYTVLDYRKKDGQPEIVKVTDITDDILTIERGCYGTTARAHNSTITFGHGVLAEDLDELDTRVVDLEQHNIISDDSIGIVDPDTAEQALRDMLATLGIPTEFIDQIVPNVMPIISSLVVNQPTDPKTAIITIADLMGFTMAYLASLSIQISMVGEQGQAISETIQAYGDVVTHDADEFATNEQGELADSAVQPEDRLWSQARSYRNEAAGTYQVTVDDGYLGSGAGGDVEWVLPLEAPEGTRFTFFGKDNHVITGADGGPGIYDPNSAIITPAGDPYPISIGPALYGTVELVKRTDFWHVINRSTNYTQRWNQNANVVNVNATTYQVLPSNGFMKNDHGDGLTATLPLYNDVVDGQMFTFITRNTLTLVAPDGSGIVNMVSGVPPSMTYISDASGSYGVVQVVAMHAAWYIVHDSEYQTISDEIVDGVTTNAPSQNAVFDALAGKSDTGHTHTTTYAPIAKRISTPASYNMPLGGLDLGVIDRININSLADNITSMSGTTTNLTEGHSLIVRITDNGVARTITWGSQWRALGATLPTTTTAGKATTVGAFWNATNSTFDVVACVVEQ